AALKIILDTPGFEIIAVHDLMSIENAAYLLQYDSVYGNFTMKVEVAGDYLQIGNKKILYVSDKDPSKLPWKDLNIDVVIESTAFLTNKEDAEKHISAGAKAVVISCPSMSKDTPTVVHGVYTDDCKTAVFFWASCTTCYVGPVME